jgi:putative acetyltransferase
MSSLVIRNEKVADQQAIYRITQLAFQDRPYADGDEQDVINRLRAAGALTLSLVAVIDDDLVGQATFSPASQSDGSRPWYALGPIAVLPDHQSMGIGSALIAEGMQGLQERSALGCILTGNPVYYERFGFVLSPSHTPKAESSQYFQVKFLTDFRPQGIFGFHRAFYD